MKQVIQHPVEGLDGGPRGRGRAFSMRLLEVVALALAVNGSMVSLGASQIAVLAGVSKYAAGDGKFDLDGPAYDVPALRDVLLRRYGFAPANIDVLLNEQATRENILATLRRRVEAARPGDRLLFYFSGHGTSAFDKGMWMMAPAIGPNSGALAPYDLQLSSADAAAASLIIGHRDLRPILSRLNPEASAWVVIDACYSENTVRSLGAEWEGPARAINLVNTLRHDATRQAGVSSAPQATVAVADEPDEPYPYPNVIAFSAASRDETARDISRQMLLTGKHKTLDGHPHGAFTNGLLAALQGTADTNHDGVVTYDELFRAVRELVEVESKQRPQVLPRAAAILKTEVFRDTRVAPAGTAHQILSQENAAPVVRVAVEGAGAELRGRISSLDGALISEKGFDLLVRDQGDRVSLYDRGRRLIREYRAAESALLLKRIEMQPAIDRLTGYRYPAQAFNVTLDIEAASPEGRSRPDWRSEFVLGESVAILASVEKPAYLLVLAIDSAGTASVLYPDGNDAEPFPDGAPREILHARVRRPTGTEYLKAFAFTEKPAGFDRLYCRTTVSGVTCPDITPDSGGYRDLLNLVGAGAGNGAQASLKLLTREP